MSPARSRYSVTTFEPGASEVFTHGLAVRPFATALRASSPAPSMTDGFEVFVQLGDRRDHDVAVVELGLRAVLERDRHADDGALGDLQAAGAAVVRLDGRGEGVSWPLWSPEAGGSEAGNESALASSRSGSPSFGSSAVVGQ